MEAIQLIYATAPMSARERDRRSSPSRTEPSHGGAQKGSSKVVNGRLKNVSQTVEKGRRVRSSHYHGFTARRGRPIGFGHTPDRPNRTLSSSLE